MENIELSTMVKEKREKQKLSQRELAKNMKVSNSLISRIENGIIKKPSYEILIKLSNELKIDFSILAKAVGYATSEEIERVSEECNKIEEMINKTFEETIINLKINDKKYDEYKYKEKNYDAIKILNAYKNGNLNEKETLILIKACKPIGFNEDKIFYPTKKGKIEIDINIKS